MVILNLAIIQFPKTSDPNKNIKKACEYVSQVKNADIVLMPEDWIGTINITWQEFMKVSNELVNLLPEKCLFVNGAGFVKVNQKQRISRGAFIYNRDKYILFEKQFPSYAIGEREYTEKGKILPVIEFKGIKIGSVICVDLFYPELVRDLALRGAEIILNPATIPDSRMRLWQKLGAVRAAENTVFIAMANTTLTTYPDGREVKGRSFIAWPDGYELQQCNDQPGVYYFKINTDIIKEIRQRWRYLDDIKDCKQDIVKIYS